LFTKTAISLLLIFFKGKIAVYKRKGVKLNFTDIFQIIIKNRKETRVLEIVFAEKKQKRKFKNLCRNLEERKEVETCSVTLF